MSLASLKLLARQFAQVSDSVVSQFDNGNVQSGETIAILDAVREYSQANPRNRTIAATLSGFEVDLATLVPEWSADTHRVQRVWWPTDLQGRYEVQPSDYWLFQKPDGTNWIRFTVSAPTSTCWIDYSAPHQLDDTTDTLSSECPSKVEAVCHLAASNILRMAANYYARQHSTSITADTVNSEQQSLNYANRAKDERAIYEGRQQSIPSGSGFVDWGYPANGQTELFWRTRRYR
ncbi:MAG: hypothetical protein E6Q97_08870 [Desulfurellales bacterium]|nr:MAG: hypothetical protein E6Q97_08870 [Desulfurellales bacterium]